MDIKLTIINYLAQFLAVMLVLSFHEFAHAYVANKCGDPTARMMGRMTLNPINHIDPVGAILFVVTGFGWARPVPINPSNFKNRWGLFFTAAAGIVTNYIMAFLIYPIYILVLAYVCPIFAGTYMSIFLDGLFSSLIVVSLSCTIFNLLPLSPLDGFRIVEALDKKSGKIYRFLRVYSRYILIGLLIISLLSSRIPMLDSINILGNLLSRAVNAMLDNIFSCWKWMFNFI